MLMIYVWNRCLKYKVIQEKYNKSRLCKKRSMKKNGMKDVIKWEMNYNVIVRDKSHKKSIQIEKKWKNNVVN